MKFCYTFAANWVDDDGTVRQAVMNIIASSLAEAEDAMKTTAPVVRDFRLVLVVGEGAEAPIWKVPVQSQPGEMNVTFVLNEKGSPVGKLADASLCFTSGPLAGLTLMGFAIWERRNGSGRNVTFPSRQYSVNGERRSYALLRPLTDVKQQDFIRDTILMEFSKMEADNEHVQMAAAQQ